MAAPPPASQLLSSQEAKGPRSSWQGFAFSWEKILFQRFCLCPFVQKWVPWERMPVRETENLGIYFSSSCGGGPRWERKGWPWILNEPQWIKAKLSNNQRKSVYVSKCQNMQSQARVTMTKGHAGGTTQQLVKMTVKGHWLSKVL